MINPPRLADWLLTRLLPSEVSEAVIGDLHEDFHSEMDQGRRGGAQWRYWQAAWRSLLPISSTDLTRAIPPPGSRRVGGLFPNLNSDVRYGARQLMRSPGFSLTAVFLLAVGIGANATVFSLVDALLKHSVPGVKSPASLARYSEAPWRRNQPAGERGSYSEYQIAEIAAASPLLQGVAGVATEAMPVDDGTALRGETVGFVSSSYFEVLQPVMHLGRAPDWDDAAAVDQIVVTYDYWQRSMHASHDAIGQIVRINRRPFTVAGITARPFRGSYRNPALFLSSAASVTLGRSYDRDGAPEPIRYPEVIGRLRNGVSPADLMRANNEESALPAARFEPMGRSLKAVMQVTSPLRSLAFLILAVASINVSLLLVGRGIVRRREIAVRLALGASRTRLVRMLVIESLLLGALACGAGIALSLGIVEALKDFYPEFTENLVLGWRASIATAILACGASLTLGLIPAMHATLNAAGEVIKAGVGGGGKGRSRLQRIFVVTEVAVSMALAGAAILLSRGVRDEVGFEAEAGFHIGPDVVVTVLSPFPNPAIEPDRQAMINDLAPRLRAIPGVGIVAFSLGSPLGLGGGVEAALVEVGGDLVRVGENHVTPDYFDAMEIPVVQGSPRDEAFGTADESAVWIDAGLARQLWPETSAVGRALTVRHLSHHGVQNSVTDTTIVRYVVAGVVGRVTSPGSGRRSVPSIYRPMERATADGIDSRLSVVLAIHNAGKSPRFALINQAIRSTRPELLFHPVATTERQMAVTEIRVIRGVVYALTITALVALVMAFAGLYAIVQFGVSQRTREIGVRVALGAQRYQVLTLFFKEGFLLAMIGFALGVPLTLALMNYGIAEEFIPRASLNTAPVAATLLTLLLVCTFACLLPARRAMRVNPIEAVRSE